MIAAAVDRAASLIARGCRRCPDRRCRMAGPADPSGRALPRRQQHRHRRAHHRAEARPTARPADRGREPRRRERQYRRRRSRQGRPRRLHHRHCHREHASGRRQSRHQPALRSDQGFRTGGHDRQPALCARALSGPARAQIWRSSIALAKAKPGVLNYGSAGVASLAHLATALFASMAGVNMTHVPYKSSAQSMTDMITGRLDMQFATIAPSLPNIRAGQLRALVTSGKTRVAALPEVPTVAESGHRRLRSCAVGRAWSHRPPPAGHHRAAQSRGERHPRFGRGQRGHDRARHGARARAAGSALPSAPAATSRSGAALWPRPASAPSRGIRRRSP